MTPTKQYDGAINQPVPFSGTNEEAEANFLTHQFGYDGDDFDARCMSCDAKVWHKAASYPCGTDVPRQVIVHFIVNGEHITETMTESEYAQFMENHDQN